VLCALASIVIEPQASSVLTAYLTLEVGPALAIVAPLALALVMFVAYCAARTLIFVGLFVAALFGAISQ